MELPVLLQLRELGAALATGLALGLAYDCLRPLGRGRLLTACADFLYALLSLAALLTFALYAGRGRLRIFALFGIAGGMSVWFWVWSGLFRRVRDGVLHALALPFSLTLRGCRRIGKNIFYICKKCVDFAGKYAKIIFSIKTDRVRLQKGGGSVAFQENFISDQASASDRRSLRRLHARPAPGSHSDRPSDRFRSGGAGRLRRAGQRPAQTGSR
ncbi:MAG: hypothetical protein II382_05630 [Oscillospiraceae bacterium]|nr:hypothetical protein [Oscillospiraceae bacterium]